jgi:hypothetical protein
MILKGGVMKREIIETNGAPLNNPEVKKYYLGLNPD